MNKVWMTMILAGIASYGARAWRAISSPEGSADAGSKLYGNARAGDNGLTLVAAGNDERFTITALFDNLGKGASGAAVQNMNIMLGFEETAGLL